MQDGVNTDNGIVDAVQTLPVSELPSGGIDFRPGGFPPNLDQSQKKSAASTQGSEIAGMATAMSAMNVTRV